MVVVDFHKSSHRTCSQPDGRTPKLLLPLARSAVFISITLMDSHSFGHTRLNMDATSAVAIAASTPASESRTDLVVVVAVVVVTPLRAGRINWWRAHVIQQSAAVSTAR